LWLLVEAEALHIARDRGLAEFLRDLRPGGVDRFGQRLCERDLPVAAVFVVLQWNAGDRHIVTPADGRFRGEGAGVDGGRGRDHLEARPGGVSELDRAVDSG